MLRRVIIFLSTLDKKRIKYELVESQTIEDGKLIVEIKKTVQ